MSNGGVLGKYLDLRTIIDSPTRVREAVDRIRPMNRSELDGLFVNSSRGGGAFLIESQGEQPGVVELIVTTREADSLATLYAAHPVFNSRAEYIKAREELVETIEDIMDAGPQGLAVACPTRGRAALLRELSLVGLVNILRQKVGQIAC